MNVFILETQKTYIKGQNYMPLRNRISLLKWKHFQDHYGNHPLAFSVWICLHRMALNIVYAKIWGARSNVVFVMNKKKVYLIKALGLLEVWNPSIRLSLCIYTLHPRMEKLFFFVNCLHLWWLYVICIRKNR